MPGRSYPSSTCWPTTSEAARCGRAPGGVCPRPLASDPPPRVRALPAGARRSALKADLGRHGQREGEAGAALLTVLCPDLAAVRLNNMACDGEAKARAAPLPRRIGLVEPLEDARLLAAGDTWPCVRHAESDGIGLDVRADADTAALRCEGERIGQQVHEHATHLRLVRPHAR